MNAFLVGVSIFGLVFACMLSPLFKAWYEDRRSRGWPITDATVDSERVYRAYRRNNYMVELSYSYQVEGTAYKGTLRCPFPTQASAEEMQTKWKTSSVPVRYNPKRPAKSYMDPFRNSVG